MTMIKSIDLTPPPYLRTELDNAYRRVMSSGQYIGGDEVTAFENEWSEYNDIPYCIACGNGFDALQLCLRALGVLPGTRVNVPAFTAPAVWSSVLSLDAIPITDKDKSAYATIDVNLYGRRISDSHPYDPTRFIEDASQSHGLQPRSDAIATVWSFYPTKNLGAYGDAGIVCSHDESFASHIRDLHNYTTRDSINSRMDPLQAAFLRVKLPYLDRWNRTRLSNARIYDELLDDLPIHKPDINAESVWHQYVIMTDRRDALRSYLAQHDIQTLIHYNPPPHRYFNLPMHLPEADRLSRWVLSLPIAPHITGRDVCVVSDAIHSFFA